MGEIRIGDLVRTPSGEVAPVIGVFPQGEKEIYRVTFSDGRSVECCDDHLWKVWRHQTSYEVGKTHATRRRIDGGAQWAVAPLSEIRSGRRTWKRAAVPLVDAAAVEYPALDQPIPPYVLGALLGDGGLRADESITFTTQDKHLTERIEQELPAYQCASDHDHRGYGYRLTLKARGDVVTSRRDRLLEIAREACCDAGFSVELRRDGKRQIRMNKWGVRGAPSLITHRRESRSLADWAALAGISPQLMGRRIAAIGLDEALGFTAKTNHRSRQYSPLAVALRDIGLLGLHSWEKFVPEAYKRGSISQRLALLQGLMDTDGSVGNGTHATFTSTSEQLAKDAQELAWSLGAIASIHRRQTHFTYKGEKKAGRPSWRVSIVMPDVSVLFSLPRKLAKCRTKHMRHRLGIKSIEAMGKKLAQCIAVDHPDHLYITDNYVVTHNTTWLGFMVCQAERHGAQVILWDKDRGLEALVHALGGSYLSLTNVPGLGSGLAPLRRLTDSADDLAFLAGLIRACIATPEAYELTPEEHRRLGIGLRHVMRLPPAERSLGEVRAFLGTSRTGAGARLEKWCWGEPFGWIIDCPLDIVALEGRLIAFDQSGVLDDPIASGAIMATLFHYTGQLVDGRRLLFVMDEVWHALSIPQFHGQIRNGLKTWRKYNSPILIGTQEVSDALASPISDTIRQQCPTQIYFANPNAVWRDHGPDGMHLSETEFAIIQQLPAGTGFFLLRQGSRSVVLQLPLAGFPELAVISGTRKGADAIRIARERTDDATGPAFVEAYHQALAEAV